MMSEFEASSSANEGQKLGFPDLRDRICVREPYFALQDLVDTGAGLRARVFVQQTPVDEVGPITMAEAGRHLAILGLCSVARRQRSSERNYYLANRAQIQRIAGALAATKEALSLTAEVTRMDRRSADAHTALYLADGTKVLTLDVTYQILSEPAFERIFASHRRDLRHTERVGEASADELASRAEPYRVPVRLEDVQLTETTLQASLQTVTPAMCSGHFPHFPALPVAVVSQALATAASTLFTHRTGVATNLVSRASTVADALAFAGEPIEISATFLESTPRGEAYRTVAKTGAGLVIAEVTTYLEPHLDTQARG